MNETEQLKKPDEPAAPPPRDERARARAYIDLWERHLVQAAAEGPAAAWMTARK